MFEHKVQGNEGADSHDGDDGPHEDNLINAFAVCLLPERMKPLTTEI